MREYGTQFRCHGHSEASGWVRARMNGAETVNADPGVALGGLQPRMTEHLGHVADIGPAFEHERCHSVTKKVTATSLLNAGPSDVMPYRA